MSTELGLYWGFTILLIVCGLARMFYVHGQRTLIFSVFLSIVMPLTFLPFAFDYRNIYTIGSSYTRIVKALPEAAFLYISFSLIFFVAFAATAHFRRRTYRPKVDVIARGTFLALTNDMVFWTLLGVQLLLVGVMVAAGVRFGGGLVDTLSNVWVRPIANIWSVWSVFVGSLAAARFFLRPTLRTGGELLLALLLSAVTGQRAVALLPIVTGLVAVLGARHSRGVVLAIVLGVSLVPGALILSELRALRASETQNVQAGRSPLTGSETIAYGNNFSEVRDFAWVLGNFNGRYLGGMTYLAGYTALVPSAILDFRSEWAFGVFTARTAGLDPRYTGGLRTGFFSEMYFNFGLIFALIGTLLFGTAVGALFRKQLVMATLSATAAQRAASDLSAYYIFVMLNAIIFTPGFFFVLVTIGVVVIMLSIHRIFPSFQRDTI